ncbi:MAG: carboxypeptidase-like regulatory domain-containing protein [Pseudomonadales bacterium]|nr:carboxypeptidase-like regulatory domain-containing protein [Pseudomonadales bacterium]
MIKLFKFSWMSLPCLFLIGCSQQVNAMGLLGFLEIDVFTELNGIVTRAEEPLSGVQVTLNVRISFNDEKFEVSTLTDESGRFHFDSIRAKSVNSFLPSAKMVEQKIVIIIDQQEYLLWEMVKNNYDYNGELNDFNGDKSQSKIIPLKIICELNDPSITRKAGTHEHVALTGICSWDGE